MRIIATQKFVKMSPQKLRVIVPMIRSLKPHEAVEVLPHVGKQAAAPIAKVLKTAIANAKQKGSDEGSLVIKEIQIGEGPRLKRWRPGARGRAKPYVRKMSHIRVVLETTGSPKPVRKEVSDKAQDKSAGRKKSLLGRIKKSGTKSIKKITGKTRLKRRQK
jgi:large subunit ribosomal protein L22